MIDDQPARAWRLTQTFPDHPAGHGSRTCSGFRINSSRCSHAPAVVSLANQPGGQGRPPCLVLEKQQLELPRSSGSCANETTVFLKTNRASNGSSPCCDGRDPLLSCCFSSRCSHAPAIGFRTHRSGGAGPA